jgi:protein disulfide-isomerase
MKFFLPLLMIVFSASLAIGQDDDYTAGHKGWLVDLDEAYEQSKETGKPILANFTGSDWCGWCKRLSAAVFVKPEFQKWAKENVILLELDFPKRTSVPDEIKAQNSKLQRAFKVRGFPTIWVFELDKEKGTDEMKINALGKTGYKSSVDEFIGDIERMLAKAG